VKVFILHAYQFVEGTVIDCGCFPEREKYFQGENGVAVVAVKVFHRFRQGLHVLISFLGVRDGNLYSETIGKSNLG
jgi:hypothetical protein